MRTKSEKISFKIKGSDLTYELSGVHTVDNLALPKQSLSKELIDGIQHLREIGDLESYIDATPMILIGQDNAFLLTTGESREGSKGLPFASYTKLGWVAHGITPRVNSSRSIRSHVTLLARNCDEKENDSQDDHLHLLVRESFQLEALGISNAKRVTPGEQRANEILEATTIKVRDKWETGLLWRDDEFSFPESRSGALKRLKSVEARLDRDKPYAKLYYAEMTRFINLGYAEKVRHSPSEGRVWYLPHFGVTNPNKPGKVRLVFDAAAKFGGMSLNDRLLAGPDLLLPLIGVIMRFRPGKIAYKGDLRDMFLKINLKPEDRDAQRFLWRGTDRSNPPAEYRMTSLLFGSKASPCSALYVKNTNASSLASIDPTASRKIIRQTYMDDLLDSCDSASEAITVIANIREINRRGGFEMHGWACNDPSVMKSIPEVESATAKPKLCVLNQAAKEKVLGLRWDTTTDTFSFDLKNGLVPSDILKGERKPTKREFLRIVMSVFDPLGFLAPLIIRSKMLMQKIWVSAIGWDEQLRDEEYETWAKWVIDLQKSNEISIPRCYSLNRGKDTTIELHVFCDAGSEAFATVAYWRFEMPNGEIETAFVISKSRVAPLKPTSIPRLELQGALIASRIAQTIAHEHDFKISRRVFWTDSRTVLSWITADARTFQTFVSHRLAEICDLTSPLEWRWVPSQSNPADSATKYTPYGTEERSRWLNGPEFLQLKESEWPKQPTNRSNEVSEATTKEQRKTTFVGLAVGESSLTFPLPDYKRFASWTSLVQATARFLLAVEIWKGAKNRRVTAEHIRRAEELRIREIQSESFAEELSALKSGRDLPRRSRILKLTPFIDAEGTLRVNGRARRVDIAEFENEPAILEDSHFVTRLLVKYYHVKMNHCGHETVMNEIRSRFWVTKLRNRLRSIIAKCAVCKMLRAKPRQPQMAELPEARVAHSLRPFSHCGLDYFGPMTVTIGRRREKRWGVLFTCLTTRAIHLELASSLSTDSAIMAIRRMSARRGQPMAIYSDNGTNFRGADTELREAVLSMNENYMHRYMANKKTEWHFIPPSSPHTGGAWERLVRSVKTALGAILKEQAPKEEALFTLLLEVEHTINSRPLTHVSPDPRDNQALTPNHFLIGTSSGQLVLPRFEIHEKCLRKQWRWAQAFADAVWKRWIKEYLPTLLPRAKWLREEQNLKIGDLVLIVDDLAPRNGWRKAIVEQVFPGQDGRVRVVQVRTDRGLLTRSAAKLIWFNSSENS